MEELSGIGVGVTVTMGMDSVLLRSEAGVKYRVRRGVLGYF